MTNHVKTLPFILIVGIMSLLSSCTPEETLQKPTLTTTSVSKITEATALCGGSISSDGGTEVTARGVCWSTASNPTIADNLTIDDSVSTIFVSNLTVLSPSTTYYVRAYATNKVGTAYGTEETFTTKSLALTTISPEFIMAQSAISGGIVSSDGDSITVKARGVCWNTFPNPTITDSITTNGKGKGSFTSVMTGLQPFTTYYVRAYVTNNNGTKYGNELNFTTQNGIISATTQPVTSILSVSATFSGSISGDGGTAVTERGFCWSTSEHPTFTNNVANVGKGTGSFSVGITGLIPNKTYYVRVYGINAVGTYYGNEISFTTNASMALVTTTAVSGITSETAVSGGLVTSDGTSNITARGVCWSTGVNPTVTLLTKTSEGTGSGPFSSTMTSLLSNTTYHVRAYATNLAGTAYGADIPFTTLALAPSLTTTAVSSIKAKSAVSGGSITSDGGSRITARGICWSTSTNPTTATNKSSDGTTGIGSYSNSFQALLPNTTYYVRAFATNAVGTSYGNEISFTTYDGVVTLTTNAGKAITAITATFGGTIASDGGDNVTARGLCWGTSSSPSVDLSTKTTNGTGTGAFSNNLSNLQPTTTYYIRAYATNGISTYYGNELSFTTTELVTDIDGNVYNTVTIGTQTWMVQNLRTTKFRDGTPIPNVTDGIAWTELTTSAYCNINNNPNVSTIFGRLYNGYTVFNSSNLAPTGWHVATDAEWTTLTTYVGGANVAGGKLKEAGYIHWDVPNANATNEYGFTALPNYYRSQYGVFYPSGWYSYWWTSTKAPTSNIWIRGMCIDDPYVTRSDYPSYWGLSVRCVKD